MPQACPPPSLFCPAQGRGSGPRDSRLRCAVSQRVLATAPRDSSLDPSAPGLWAQVFHLAAMLCDEGASAQAQGGSRCASILPWVVRAARALSHFTARFRAKLLYSGQAFRAFALAGVNMARGGVAAARLEHSPLPSNAGWTLQVLLRLDPDNVVPWGGAGASGGESSRKTLVTIIEAHNLLLAYDVASAPGQLVLQAPAGDGLSSHATGAACPPGEWALVSLVADAAGALVLWVDARCVWQHSAAGAQEVPALRLVSAGGVAEGGAERLPTPHRGGAFCGALREVRLFAEALAPGPLRRAAALGPDSAGALHAHWSLRGAGGRATVTVTGPGALGASLVPAADSGAAEARAALSAEEAEEHWLLRTSRAANVLAATAATRLARGHNPSEEEALCERWLSSPLFAPGIGAEVTVSDMEARATSPVIVGLLQQRVAVRLSPELDNLECLVMVPPPPSFLQLPLPVSLLYTPSLPPECLVVVPPPPPPCPCPRRPACAARRPGAQAQARPSAAAARRADGAGGPQVVALHHCAVLERVLREPEEANLQPERPPWLEATCRSVSLAARQVRPGISATARPLGRAITWPGTVPCTPLPVGDFTFLPERRRFRTRQMRRHVMELRDLANHALKEGEEPRGWDVYCDPLLRRCGLLLQVSPPPPSPPY